MMMFKESKKSIRFELGRTDASDYIAKNNRMGWRLAIGHMLLSLRGNIESEEMRLDLWNAEVRATIKTDCGSVFFRCFTHSEFSMNIIEVKTGGGEDGALVFQPEKGEVVDWANMPLPGRKMPPYKIRREGDIFITVQPLSDSGSFATAIKSVALSKHHVVHYIAIAYSAPENTSENEALDLLASCAEDSLFTLVKTHRRFWHAYYPRSFVSFTDNRWESFYWIQMYKLASATRADKPMIDDSGPWHLKGGWPLIWWNLEAQLTYAPVYTANRLDLGMSFYRTIVDHAENLRKNTRRSISPSCINGAYLPRATSYDCKYDGGEAETPGWRLHNQSSRKEQGNLLWALHNCFLQYRYSMDESMLKKDIFPLLKAAVNYHLSLLVERDGVYHLRPTLSPEYGEHGDHNTFEDANYDLALLRWGLETLLLADERIGACDALSSRWRDVLANLTPFPADSHGLMIGSNQSCQKPHRHYSHLLAIWPLHVLSLDNPAHRDLVSRSIKHWIDINYTGEGILTGYSYPAMAALCALMRNGDEAIRHLDGALESGWVGANTLFAHGKPLNEAPSGCAEAIHLMLLQSYGGVIRVFPAVPARWTNASFHDLRAEGAFLISARREEGRTTHVRIRSVAGEPCIIELDIASMRIEGARVFSITSLGKGRYSVDLNAGEEIGFASPEL